MSTQKFLAKVVKRNPYNGEKPYKGFYRWFELEDGRQFALVRGEKPEDFLHTKIYMIKKLNVFHGEKWAYEIYEVPLAQARHKRYKEHFTWFHDTPRYFCYEI